MLTNRPAEKPSASWSAAHVGVTIILSVITSTSAYAGGAVNLNCVSGGKTFNCVGQYATSGDPYVRSVPEPLGEPEKAEVAARERKWITRCHPVVERDSYGVARYQYAAPGCEYGLGTD